MSEVEEIFSRHRMTVIEMLQIRGFRENVCSLCHWRGSHISYTAQLHNNMYENDHNIKRFDNSKHATAETMTRPSKLSIRKVITQTLPALSQSHVRMQFPSFLHFNIQKMYY